MQRLFIEEHKLSTEGSSVDKIFGRLATRRERTEEADQKLVRHTLYCIKEEYTSIEIQSIDYDVLILLLAYVATDMESNTASTATPARISCSSRGIPNLL